MTLLALALAACGGGGDDHFSGSAMIDYHGTMSIPSDGVAFLANGHGMVVVFGTGSVDCDTQDNSSLGDGTYAEMQLQAITGQYPSESITLFDGSDTSQITGDVTLTTVTADSVAGTVTAMDTDNDLGVNGTFTVESCI
ncbi:MAG TPA: hypothetical protein VGM88_32840 [Kofleriaceae bacterium]|jgi:hypothetical protein